MSIGSTGDRLYESEQVSFGRNCVATYTASNILQHPSVRLTQGGLILVAILRGGDYDVSGLAGCGVGIAHGLAMCGFGDRLLEAAQTLSRQELTGFLNAWRQDLRAELQTNARGYIGRKYPSVAKSVTDDFPDVDVLFLYVHPITSETIRPSPTPDRFWMDWEREPQLDVIARLCRFYFGWSHAQLIVNRLHSAVWPGVVLRALRYVALSSDRENASRSDDSHRTSVISNTCAYQDRVLHVSWSMIAGRFSSVQIVFRDDRHSVNVVKPVNDYGTPLFIKIHRARRHPSTSGILEYRVDVDTTYFGLLCGLDPDHLKGNSGVRSSACDESANCTVDAEYRKQEMPRKNAYNTVRMWLPATMVQRAEPRLVAQIGRNGAAIRSNVRLQALNSKWKTLDNR